MKNNLFTAAVSAANNRDASALIKILDKMKHPTALPLICDVNRCGLEGHAFAWDTLEEWQNA